jgi:hypothetical protein
VWYASPTSPPASYLTPPVATGYYMATLEAALQHILDLADDFSSSSSPSAPCPAPNP